MICFCSDHRAFKERLLSKKHVSNVQEAAAGMWWTCDYMRNGRLRSSRVGETTVCVEQFADVLLCLETYGIQLQS